MARRFNYTSRQRILQKHVRIRVTDDAGRLEFDAALDLESYQFPVGESAPRVFIEAYRRATSTWKRFDFGTTSELSAPHDRSLAEFGVPAGILFRVKVTESGGASLGRLIAQADRIRPLSPDESDSPAQPLIEHIPAPDIGDELWRVDFSGDMPLLKINSKLSMGADQFLLDPRHRAMFAPAVMRTVLSRILVVEGYSGDEDDQDDWRRRWLKFGAQLCGTNAPEYEDDSDLELVETWIDSAVESFSRRAHLRTAFEAGGEA